VGRVMRHPSVTSTIITQPHFGVKAAIQRTVRFMSTLPQLENEWDEQISINTASYSTPFRPYAVRPLQFKQHKKSSFVEFIDNIPRAIRNRQEELMTSPKAFHFVEDPVTTLFRYETIYHFDVSLSVMAAYQDLTAWLLLFISTNCSKEARFLRSRNGKTMRILVQPEPTLEILSLRMMNRSHCCSCVGILAARVRFMITQASAGCKSSKVKYKNADTNTLPSGLIHWVP